MGPSQHRAREPRRHGGASDRPRGCSKVETNGSETVSNEPHESPPPPAQRRRQLNGKRKVNRKSGNPSRMVERAQSASLSVCRQPIGPYEVLRPKEQCFRTCL